MQSRYTRALAALALTGAIAVPAVAQARDGGDPPNHEQRHQVRLTLGAAASTMIDVSACMIVAITIAATDVAATTARPTARARAIPLRLRWVCGRPVRPCAIRCFTTDPGGSLVRRRVHFL